MAAIYSCSGNQLHPEIYGDRIVWHAGGGSSWNIYMYDLSTEQVTPITTTNTATYARIYDNRIVWQDAENIYMATIS